MKKRNRTFRRVCTLADVAINSIIRFPRRPGLFKVESIVDGVVFLSKVERNAQLSFVPSVCKVYVVEGV